MKVADNLDIKSINKNKGASFLKDNRLESKEYLALFGGLLIIFSSIYFKVANYLIPIKDPLSSYIVVTILSVLLVLIFRKGNLKRTANIFYYIALSILTFLSSQFFVAFILSLFTKVDDIKGNSSLVFVTSVSVYLIMLLLMVIIDLFIVRKQKFNLRYLKLDRLPNFGDALKGLAGWGIYFLIAQIVVVVLTASNLIDVNEKQEILFSTNSYGLGLFLAFVTIVILAPLVEEILYRGILFGNLSKKINPFLAAIIASLIFGVFHGQLNVGIDTFFMSMVSCYLVWKTDSIWPGVFLHTSKNLIAFVLLFIVKLQ